jgi:uncharacterized repeat protein (TIGR01451 family)
VFDLFRRDLSTGTTVRIAEGSPSSGADVIGSDMTPDGLVVSVITRTELLPEQPTPSITFDVYAVDLRPAADLAVTKNDSPDPVVVRANLTYTVTVRNLGPAAARDVTTFDQLPADAVFISATPTQGSCARGRDGVLACALGTVNPFAAPTVTIVVSPSRSGATLTNSATVRANSPDPDLANNRATATTTVVAK